MLKLLKQKRYYLAAFIAVAFVLLYTPTASACILSTSPISNCILQGSSYLVYLMFSVAGSMVGFLTRMLYITINIPVYPAGGMAVIDESWKIMRNFANMFFIVALIMMAFATIFDVLPGFSKYNAKSLFAKFLFTALLINFSLVLGVLVIKGTQVLSNTFLISIGDMSGRLGQAMDPSKLLPTGTDATFSDAISQGLFGTLISLIFSVILVYSFLFSILTALIFSLVRIPILWTLLVVSPMAWMLNIFPAGQGMYKKWWSTFIGWNMFLPIFLFFLYFAMYFLSNQPAVMQAIATQTSNQQVLDGVPFTFQQIFFYVLAAIFLIGGTMTAMKASMFAGTGVVGVAKWGREKVLKTKMPFIGSYASWQAGAQQKWKEMETEGYGVGKYRMGGSKALEAETARRARILGTKGALGKGIDMEKEKQKPYAHDVVKLDELANSGTREQRLAARERLTELGALSREQVLDTEKLYGIDREAANKYINSVDFGKFQEIDRKEFAKVLTNLEALKKNATAMIEKDKLTADSLEALVNFFAARNQNGQIMNGAEINDILEKGKKKNVLEIAKLKVRLGLPGAAATEDEELKKAFDKMTDAQILELDSTNFTGTDMDSIRVRTELNRILKANPKRLENIVRQATGEMRNNLERILERNMLMQAENEATRINADFERLRQERDNFTTQLQTVQQELVNLENVIQQSENDITQAQTGIDNARNPAERIQFERQIDRINRDIDKTMRRIKRREQDEKNLQNELKQANKTVKALTSAQLKPGEEREEFTYTPDQLKDE